MLAGKRKLKRPVMDTICLGTTITVEDVEAMAAIESLREVRINFCSVELGALEAFLTSLRFVDRLERLNICAKVISKCLRESIQGLRH